MTLSLLFHHNHALGCSAVRNLCCIWTDSPSCSSQLSGLVTSKRALTVLASGYALRCIIHHLAHSFQRNLRAYCNGFTSISFSCNGSALTEDLLRRARVHIRFGEAQSTAVASLCSSLMFDRTALHPDRALPNTGHLVWGSY